MTRPGLLLPLITCLAGAAYSAPTAESVLARMLAAHNADAFQTLTTAEFDLEGWPFSSKAPLADHHLLDLKNARTLIFCNNYRLAFDGRRHWVTPSLEAAGVRAGFYVSQSGLMFQLPFLFASTGAVVSLQSPTVLKATTPAVPGATFTLEVSSVTGRLQSAVVQPQAKSPLEAYYSGPVIFVYQSWQEVSDCWVPATVSVAKNGPVDVRKAAVPSGTVNFRNVRFSDVPPEKELFALPAGALVE